MISPHPRLHFADEPGAMLDALERSGAAIVEGFPLDRPAQTLVAWAGRLGALSSHGIGAASAVEACYVHIVRPLAAPTRDRYGNIVRSTTRVAMACHTDDYFSADPIDTVALLCCRSDPGVATLIAGLDRALGELSADTIEVLREAIYPTPFGQVAVLTEEGIRYDGYEIGKMRAAGRDLCDRGAAALDALAGALVKIAEPIVLAEAQCLLVDNRRVLHGRTAIGSDSRRELRRIRFHRYRGRALLTG